MPGSSLFFSLFQYAAMELRDGKEEEEKLLLLPCSHLLLRGPCALTSLLIIVKSKETTKNE